MFKSTEFIGISLEGDILKVARVVKQKNQLHLVRVDELTLVEPIKRSRSNSILDNEPDDSEFELGQDADLIFGLDDEVSIGEKKSKGKKSISEEETSSKPEEDDLFGDIDLDDLDAVDFGNEEEDDLLSQSSDDEVSNEKLIHDYLSGVDASNRYVTVNVPSGDTIFQFLSDLNYAEIKKKEVLEVIEEKLIALYERKPNEDHYDFKIRDDGTLIIGSVDHESPTLKIVYNAVKRFNENYQIKDVIPDESVMMGMYRNHYDMDSEIITALLQIGKKKSRLLFMRGNQLLQVSPVINEGYSNKNYLSTIFSKILFQIDTGEVPALDQLIIFNNGKGEKVLDFFRSSFSELKIEEFQFKSDQLIFEESLTEIVPSYSTAIGLACIAAKKEMAKKVDLSFLPSYVIDQQKVFRLQWHGILLLVLIGFSPVVINYFYQQNSAEIDSLELRSNQLTSMISNVNPLVQRSEELSQELSLMQDQLTLLTDLNEDNIRWTVTMNHINRAVQNIGNTWITSFRQNEDVIMIEGYSLFKNRIPELAGQFESVTLLNVRKQELRERDIYSFSMMIRDVVEDRSLFTPTHNPGTQQASTQ